jgi:DNA invertase Pin-like site-specific DNA recombinase
MSTRRVIGIVRVSTPGQVGEDKFGVARQRHDIEQAAKAHGLDIIRIVSVVESGTTAFRNEDFKQVFADLARPDIAGAVVSAVDRLVRPGFLGDLQVFDHFQRSRKLLFTPGQVIDVESEAGWLVSGMFGLSAGLEKRAILKRTLSGKERARDSGKHPGGAQLLPRGLAYSKEDGWRYIEPDAGRVRKAYDLLFAGMSFTDIASEVGFRTGHGVAIILRNTCWKGIRTYAPNGSRVVPMEKPMGIKPLISAERWAAAQVILDAKRTKYRARKRQDRAVSIGLGLLRCKRCVRFYYLRRDYRPGQHDLFWCRCGAPSIRRIPADAAIVEAVVAMANVKMLRKLVDAAMAKPAAKAQPAAKTQREIARVAADRERLIDLRVKGKISEEQFDKRDAALAAEARDLEGLLPKAEPALDPAAMAAAIASLLAEFDCLPVEKQAKQARRLFVAFDVNEDGDGLERVVMRGEVLASTYAKNVRRSRSRWPRRFRAPA